MSFFIISAVFSGGALKFDVFFGSCNSTVFVEFLKKLMHDAPGLVFLVLDNVPFHKTQIVKDYVASLGGQLKLFFLPGYSPELNPDEWVWKNVKSDDIKRRGIRRGSELFGIATRALERLQRLPETIRGFFRDPTLAYIG